MKFTRPLLLTSCFLALISAISYAKETPKFTPTKLAIKTAPHGWGKIPVEAVSKVTDSVSSVLMRDFPNKVLDPIILKNDKTGPEVLYKRGRNNDYIVHVNIQGTYWAQLTYQFSHELCHVLSNFANENGKNQWFEEALCEAVSLYTIEKMADEWEVNPPYERWRSYASAFDDYNEVMLNETHRYPSLKLPKWFRYHRRSIEASPYQRHKDEVIGTAIYKLMQKGKFQVSSIQYLNLGDADNSKSFTNYLKDWHQHSPPESKPSVEEVAKLVNINLE